MRNYGISLVSLLVAAAFSGGVYAADAAKGEVKAGYCYGCHQIGGYRNAYPAYSVPKLAGQHREYIVAALKAYKDGSREHGTMRAIAASLSEQDMADIAAYYAASPAQQPFSSPSQPNKK